MQTIGQIIVGVIFIGGLYALSRTWLRMMEIHLMVRELDRDIAREEHYKAALDRIEENERQAQRRDREIGYARKLRGLF